MELKMEGVLYFMPNEYINDSLHYYKKIYLEKDKVISRLANQIKEVQALIDRTGKVHVRDKDKIKSLEGSLCGLKGRHEIAGKGVGDLLYKIKALLDVSSVMNNHKVYIFRVTSDHCTVLKSSGELVLSDENIWIKIEKL